MFLPGVVSTEEAWEFSITFSPDGTEFYFTRRRGSGGDPKHRDGRNTILVSRCEGDTWSPPEVATFSGQYPDHEPYITLDGASLLWGSNRPLPSGGQAYRIWRLERIGDRWGEPELAQVEGMYITATAAGTIFTSGIDKYEPERGSYGEPISVGIRGSNPFIAPDESFMVFDRERRIEGEIHSFMFITNRNENGDWGEPIELPGDLNRGICPMITPDGKYFFFSVDGDLYWVGADVLEPFRND